MYSFYYIGIFNIFSIFGRSLQFQLIVTVRGKPSITKFSKQESLQNEWFHRFPVTGQVEFILIVFFFPIYQDERQNKKPVRK